jgi:hypothetical protein
MNKAIDDVKAVSSKALSFLNFSFNCIDFDLAHCRVIMLHFQKPGADLFVYGSFQDVDVLPFGCRHHIQYQTFEPWLGKDCNAVLVGDLFENCFGFVHDI